MILLNLIEYIETKNVNLFLFRLFIPCYFNEKQNKKAYFLINLMDKYVK